MNKLSSHSKFLCCQKDICCNKDTLCLDQTRFSKCWCFFSLSTIFLLTILRNLFYSRKQWCKKTLNHTLLTIPIFFLFLFFCQKNRSFEICYREWNICRLWSWGKTKFFYQLKLMTDEMSILYITVETIYITYRNNLFFKLIFHFLSPFLVPPSPIPETILIQWKRIYLDFTRITQTVILQ